MKNTHSEFLKQLYQAPLDSHKGQNGKVLVIGGSSLFHAASIWAAQIASYLNDMVHFSSVEENNEIMRSLKEKFRNGIVVNQIDIPTYAKEDDCILIGPGMVRSEAPFPSLLTTWQDIIGIENEGFRTRNMVHFLIQNNPEKKFVLDAGAIQMMDAEWLLQLKQPAIVTPHQIEFERLFGISVNEKSEEEKIEIVKETAKKWNVIILLKAIVDIISDGNECVVVEGGNPGLTKGGTGDVLSGTVASFYAKNNGVVAAVSASTLLKCSAEELGKVKGNFYNVDNLVDKMPEVLKQLLS